jgi:HAD superfamily hydrolase (TIGR01450 family)
VRPDITTVLCDLDGVVWLAHEPIPGSVEAIRALRGSGRRVLFVTNNSAAVVASNEAALAAIGVEAVGDVVSSAMAAASLVAPGERVLVTGGPGVAEAVARRGATAVMNTGDDTDCGASIDAVIVGLHRDFDYQRLRVASREVRKGARLIGTNSDTTFPTPTGLEPGGGAILAAVAAAAGTDPVIAGKPEQPMADVIAELLAPPDAPFDPAGVVMVGDRPETDGLFARRIGCDFMLVDTGVTPSGAEVASSVPVAMRYRDLAALAAALDAESASATVCPKP